MTASAHILYGAEVSYYAGKIRAYFVHKGIPFDERLATRAVFDEVILPRVGWPVIPVVVTADGTTLQDTSEMIDWFETRYPLPRIVSGLPGGGAFDRWLELLGDEWLKMPALYYRWTYDRDFAVAEFGRNNDPGHAPAEQARIGGKIAARFAGWLAPLGAAGAGGAAIEAGYHEFLGHFDAHLAQWPYLLGTAPTLGDFAFYGPLYAHLYRDPNSGRVMRERAPRVCAWVERLRDGVDAGRGADAVDVLPASLVPVLECLARDYLPVLRAQTVHAQAALAAHAPGAELPRHFGEQVVTLGRGTAAMVEVTRAVFSYDQWLLQRVQDAARAAPDPALATLFEAVGAAGLLDLDTTVRVARRNFKLVRSPGAP
ncbi:MAG: glutathione S-transferase [Gammaproteobacteria bacterium]|nr:glutathione S-transferase [Gammaproteobacteria bacterium]